jgi:hypothetical protein
MISDMPLTVVLCGMVTVEAALIGAVSARAVERIGEGNENFFRG